eukprot:TRINITY_DN13481_c0_g2_i1.p1 TRINITY_DN13481_c0_g2~~TRINITY_DN13481_c0_g2_i1.p1  ORF type:complete len:847 (-),score=198.89 TRINITY_DN13481_c0_g2_i1:23-2563(-)
MIKLPVLPEGAVASPRVSSLKGPQRLMSLDSTKDALPTPTQDMRPKRLKFPSGEYTSSFGGLKPKRMGADGLVSPHGEDMGDYSYPSPRSPSSPYSQTGTPRRPGRSTNSFGQSQKGLSNSRTMSSSRKNRTLTSGTTGFSSLAINLEIKLGEVLTKYRDEPKLHEPRTNAVLQIFDELAEAPTVFQTLLQQIGEEVRTAIYSGYVHPDPSAQSVFDAQPVPYYEAVQRLEGQIDLVEGEKDNLTVRLRTASQTPSKDESLHTKVLQLQERIEELEEELREEQARANEQEDKALQLNEKLIMAEQYSRLVEENLENTELKLTEAAELPHEVHEVQQELELERTKFDEVHELLIESLANVRSLSDKMSTMIPEEEHKKNTEQKEKVESDLKKLKTQYGRLLGHAQKIDRELTVFKEQAGRMTPRPDWTQLESTYTEEDLCKSSMEIGEMITADVEQLRSENNTLRTSVVELRTELDHLKEFMGETKQRTVHSSDAEHFVGLGNGQDVPKYLRYTGKVQNRHLSKGDTEKMINDIWKSKNTYDKMRRKPEDLGTYFFTYLQKRFGRQAMICSWAYNIIDALRRFQYDPDLEMFLKILEGKLSLSVYTDQELMIKRLLDRLRAFDCQDRSNVQGVLAKTDFFELLKKMFPAKNDVELLELKRALHRDQPGKMVKYEALFEEDAEFNQGDFAETLRGQHLHEIEELCGEIEDGIHAVDQTGGKVTINAIRLIITQVDSGKPPKVIDEMICKGLELDPKPRESYSDALRSKGGMVVSDIPRFCSNMRGGGAWRRHSPRRVDGSSPAATLAMLKSRGSHANVVPQNLKEMGRQNSSVANLAALINDTAVKKK